jgi:hypothetical protein
LQTLLHQAPMYVFNACVQRVPPMPRAQLGGSNAGDGEGTATWRAAAALRTIRCPAAALRCCRWPAAAGGLPPGARAGAEAAQGSRRLPPAPSAQPSFMPLKSRGKRNKRPCAFSTPRTGTPTSSNACSARSSSSSACFSSRARSPPPAGAAAAAAVPAAPALDGPAPPLAPLLVPAPAATAAAPPAACIAAASVAWPLPWSARPMTSALRSAGASARRVPSWFLRSNSYLSGVRKGFEWGHGLAP